MLINPFFVVGFSYRIYARSEVNSLLSITSSKWMSSNELMESLGLSHKATFRENYLKPALEKGLIVMSAPDSPRSPKQKYKKAE